LLGLAAEHCREVVAPRAAHPIREAAVQQPRRHSAGALDAKVLVPEEGLEPSRAHLILELGVVAELRLHRALAHEVEQLERRRFALQHHDRRRRCTHAMDWSSRPRHETGEEEAGEKDDHLFSSPK
jgi:phage gp29-like protein